MPYERFPDQVQGMLFVSWYDMRALGQALKAARKINFAITEQRQQVLERLANLIDDCPFDMENRFPENAAFICESWGDWARKFQQLKSALSYKSTDKDPKAKGDSGNRDADFNDSQQAFWNATTAMYDQISRADGVWNQKSFELYYSLRWRDPQQQGAGAAP